MLENQKLNKYKKMEYTRINLFLFFWKTLFI